MMILTNIVMFRKDTFSWRMAIKVGKEPGTAQLPLSNYKQYGSNLDGEVIKIVGKIDS